MKSKYSKSKIAALTLTFVCATTAMASATTLQYGDKGKNVIAVQPFETLQRMPAGQNPLLLNIIIS